ncbi:MAG: methylmalonyl-CoA mutase family protein [Bacteroidota bacterium]
MKKDLINKDENTFQEEKLLEEFQPATYEQWLKTAELSLKGKTLEKLFSNTYENILIKPLFTSEDIKDFKKKVDSYPGFYPFLRGTNSFTTADKLKVAQTYSYSNYDFLQEAIGNDCKMGLDSVILKINKYPSEGNSDFSVPIFCSENFGQILKNFSFDKNEIFLDIGNDNIQLASVFFAFLDKNKIEKIIIKGGFCFDPFAELLTKGSYPVSMDIALNEISTLLNHTKKFYPKLNAFAIKADTYNNAGANAVQELGFFLAETVTYFKELIKRGHSIDEIAQNTFVNLAVGPDFFMEIAKLRAVRVLWAKAVKAFNCNEESQKVKLHTSTCKWNKSKLDPYVNILRNTGETTAAILGGADSMNIRFFDEHFGLPDNFSRRITRNIAEVLKNECNFFETIDPAGGTWYVEYLTDNLARMGWNLFKEIEEMGGFLKAIENGFVANQIEAVKINRQRNYAIRKDTLLGANKFANLNEKPIEKTNLPKSTVAVDYEKYLKNRNVSFENESLSNILKSDNFVKAISLAKEGATVSEISNIEKSSPVTISKALDCFDAGKPFEELREFADNYKKKNKHFPTFFFAKIGQVSKVKARVDFVSDFFSVGGFVPLSDNSFNNYEDAVSAFMKSNEKFIVICSTDDKYSEIVSPLVQSIKQQNPSSYIILAGYLKDKIDEFKIAGVDDFIHVKADIVEVLSKMQKVL